MYLSLDIRHVSCKQTADLFLYIKWKKNIALCTCIFHGKIEQTLVNSKYGRLNFETG